MAGAIDDRRPRRLGVEVAAVADGGNASGSKRLRSVNSQPFCLWCGTASSSKRERPRSRSSFSQSGSAERVFGAATVTGAQRRGRYPMEPSIWSSIRRFISTAYSIGSSRVKGSMKPPTIMPDASSSERPRLIR